MHSHKGKLLCGAQFSLKGLCFVYVTHTTIHTYINKREWISTANFQARLNKLIYEYIRHLYLTCSKAVDFYLEDFYNKTKRM